MRNNIVNFSDKELASTRKATEALLASTSATTSTLSCLAAGMVKLLRAGAKEFEDKTSGHCYNILTLTKISLSDAVRSAPIVSLLQDIVEQGTLVEVFGSKVRELEIISKDVAIDQLKSLVASGNVNQNVPEIALRALLRILVDNQHRKTGCRWSEATKSLFAIILDYGGPALAKIITEKLGGPSLVTMYCSARCNYAIPQKLEAQIFSWAASFYKEIGYTGVFSLAVDATAITLLLKVKGNRLIGLAYETEVLLKTAEDTINVVKDENTEKAKQANAFILAPLEEHVPSFILAISPVYKGQDHALVRHWFNQVLLWAGRRDMSVVGLGADGDSKVRKYYTERYKWHQGQTNSVIDIDFESFDYNFVVEDLREIGVEKPIPMIMFPAWRHLIKKWRNQLLNVKCLLIIGEGVAQLEHLMKTFEKDKLRCGLWKSDVFVKDKQNVEVALRIFKRRFAYAWRHGMQKKSRKIEKITLFLFKDIKHIL